jgi:hypothetical protein
MIRTQQFLRPLDDEREDFLWGLIGGQQPKIDGVQRVELLLAHSQLCAKLVEKVLPSLHAVTTLGARGGKQAETEFSAPGTTYRPDITADLDAAKRR